jgi:hypothetical protein
MQFECTVYPEVHIGPRPGDAEEPWRPGEVGDALNEPWLYASGKPRRLSPTRQHWDYAVGLLLKLQAPRYLAECREKNDRIRKAVVNEDAEEYRRWCNRKLNDIPEEELVPLKRIGLALARKIGFKWFQASDQRDPYPCPMTIWLDLASRVQRIFGMNDQAVTEDEAVAEMEVYLARALRGRMSIEVRPCDLRSALCYWAALMVARGISVRSCKHCASPIMTGAGRGKYSKKASSKFCNTHCKNAYHNARR